MSNSRFVGRPVGITPGYIITRQASGEGKRAQIVVVKVCEYTWVILLVPVICMNNEQNGKDCNKD
jgi:hypothetical protein